MSPASDETAPAVKPAPEGKPSSHCAVLKSTRPVFSFNSFKSLRLTLIS